MGDKIKLNHHSASVLPYNIDKNGDLQFILEQKDPAYKKPFFDSGVNFEGGNREKGVHTDISPEATVKREIREEFWDMYEASESLNALLGQEFIVKEPKTAGKYDEKSVQRLKQAVPIFIKGMNYAGDYIMTVNAPITKTPLVYASSIFLKKLSEEEFKAMEELIKEFDGKLTTDNLKWGSRITAVSLRQINEQNIKCAWGYCGIINSLLRKGQLPSQPTNIIRPLTLVENIELTLTENFPKGIPNYDVYEKTYEYLVKK